MIKTQDYIDKVRKLGYTVEATGDEHEHLAITYFDGEGRAIVMYISVTWEVWGYIREYSFAGGKEIELLRLTLDYLETPLEDRGQIVWMDL